MPAKTNYTGTLGLVVEGSGFVSNVAFTFATNQIPDSFDFAWKNKIPAIGTMQFPAQYGNGSDEWYFLMSATPHSDVRPPINVGFYIIEMQTVQENTTSTSITLLSFQVFLYKVKGIEICN